VDTVSSVRLATESDVYVNGDTTAKRKDGEETGKKDKETKRKFKSGKSNEEVGRGSSFLSQ
jgi:hypothetical protein